MDFLALTLRKTTRKPLITWLDEIAATVLRFAANPYLGAARPDIAPELRYSPVGRYSILYRILTVGVHVVRIVHGARKLSDLL